jgi:hypothetical protein
MIFPFLVSISKWPIFFQRGVLLPVCIRPEQKRKVALESKAVVLHLRRGPLAIYRKSAASFYVPSYVHGCMKRDHLFLILRVERGIDNSLTKNTSKSN